MIKYWNQFRLWLRKSRPKLAPTQIIAIVFALIILAGALLLNLPVSSRNGESCGFVPALFTATSATCVTGLVLFDTWTQWSGFGQTVILCLIEVGGLGCMSAAAVVVFMLRKKVSLRQRMVMAQALSVSDMDGIVRLQKWVLGGSILIQLSGALVLFVRFLPEYGALTAAKWGVFHSVSAFCNAGFDIFGKIDPGQSVAMFQSDPVVLITLMALVVLGGLGFFVWEEVATVRSWKKYSVYTKLVLIMSGILLLGGTLGFCLLEWNNPETLGAMSTPDKLLNAFFQSVTLRTAGFASVDQGALTDGGKGFSMLLMLLGGSSGSTAGGVKVGTFGLLIYSACLYAFGRKHITVFRRTVPKEDVIRAFTLVTVQFSVTLLGALILIGSGVDLMPALFETFSASATVGLSMGLTPALSMASRLVIMTLMFFGRVGILTVATLLCDKDVREQNQMQYADIHLMIG